MNFVASGEALPENFPNEASPVKSNCWFPLSSNMLIASFSCQTTEFPVSRAARVPALLSCVAVKVIGTNLLSSLISATSSSDDEQLAIAISMAMDIKGRIYFFIVLYLLLFTILHLHLYQNPL